MPELPEVETTRRGISPHIVGQILTHTVVRVPQLRWAMPDLQLLAGATLTHIDRRAKYLLLHMQKTAESGQMLTLMIHLGMSGSLRVIPEHTPAQKHDHVDWCFANGQCLRLTDPRRFGAVFLFPSDEVNSHPRLAGLAPEPLSPAFDVAYLTCVLKARQKNIKACLMDNHLVVGVGNIYANEALFQANIHPETPSGLLQHTQITRLHHAIQSILRAAIDAGGSSLRDYVHADGSLGFFQQQYFVYGRKNEPCRVCKTTIISLTQQTRSSFFCPQCQAQTPA